MVTVSMAMRYLSGKLRAPAAAANASQGGSSTRTTGSTSSVNLAKNGDEEVRLLLEEVAKLEAASKEIEETIRHNKFHNRCIMWSAVLGVGLGGVFCGWYTYT